MQLATIVYVRHNGQTLMLHRVKKAQDMHAGKWNGLGGKLEPGETPEECAVREVLEESGLLIEQPRLHGMIVFPQFSKGVDWFTFVFVAEQFSGDLIDSTEGVLAWIPDDRLLELELWPGDRIFLRWLDEDGFFSAKFVYLSGELTNYQVVFYTRDEITAARSDHVLPDGWDGGDAVPEPHYRPQDDTYCWLCHGPVIKRHCKIVCQVCGFTRDCSDP